MNELYPIKFKTIYKDKIWGGQKLATSLNKDVDSSRSVGESWELCGIEGDLSIAANGFLEGNDIQELVEIYMGDLVGDSVYEKFGIEFPLLFKFIDAQDYLSVQLHPGDELARQKHNSYGKAEMWYIVDAEKDAELIAGFNQEMTQNKFMKYFGSGALREILNFEKVSAGSVFFIPPGKVHAICPGILLAEIQQASDITYRIYDWDRVDDEGKARELHVDDAVDSMSFDYTTKNHVDYASVKNESTELVACDYFTTNVIDLNSRIEKDYNWLDSFVVYMCVQGNMKITYSENGDCVSIKKGETILIPAVIKNLFLETESNEDSRVLEVYIKQN